MVIGNRPRPSPGRIARSYKKGREIVPSTLPQLASRREFHFEMLKGELSSYRSRLIIVLRKDHTLQVDGWSINSMSLAAEYRTSANKSKNGTRAVA
jgi:hypothetical protein